MTLAQVLAATLDNGTLTVGFVVLSGGALLLVRHLLLRRFRRRRPAAHPSAVRKAQTK